MRPLKIFSTDQYTLPLPEGHRFPVRKYGRLRERVAASGLVASGDFCAPRSATDQELERVHNSDYLRRLTLGQLTDMEVRRLGIPWSPEMVERAWRGVGATVEVCGAAVDDGCAINLGGGTHHAFPDHGEGYCALNDVAVAARALQDQGRVRRAVMIDCDVHQGNGTARIFAGDPTVFTFSIHGAKNYPYHKETSDLDVELPDRADDEMYLDALEPAVKRALDQARADLAIYLAGADPFCDDMLGRMALSKPGLLARDRLVFDLCRAAGVPVAVVMAGGYARDIEDTVDIHLQTVRLAQELFG